MSSQLFPSPRYVHLQLTRVGTQSPRRKQGGGRGYPSRNPGEHGIQLKASVEGILQRRQVRPKAQGINPELVLRVHLAQHSAVDPEEWARSGFTVLGSQPNNVVLLFANDLELTKFRQRIADYATGTSGVSHTQHYKWLGAIERVAEWGPTDRRGRTLAGVNLPALADVTLDVELWYPGDRSASQDRIAVLRQLLQERQGRLLDSFIGQSLVLARIRMPGAMAEDVLAWDMVFSVELPPKPEFSQSQAGHLILDALPPVQPPPEDAPGVCVLDSGIAAGHALLGPAVGETTAIPLTLGTPADVQGHGTKVAGLALYGDVQECITLKTFEPKHWLYSIRVTNENNEFDDAELIERQMQDAIEYATKNWGCRVFNISLGDCLRSFDGGRVSSWAATLDELARRYNILIVVSAGNYVFLPDNNSPFDSHVNGYPDYLFQDSARIIPPAEGANVLTVGSLARAGAPYMSERYPEDVLYRTPARESEPSPFTRCGPGIKGAIKPELVEFGGNYSVNEKTGKLDQKDPGVARVSLSREIASGRLFEFDSGTSFAAPSVAYAGARVVDAFPQASANLVRALLASSATVPDAARAVIGNEDRIRQLCGYGRPDVEAAISSRDERVVLIAEDELGADMFHIYEVPLPDIFRLVSGRRSIGVALAFDPPTRHTRLDYTGTTMDFRLLRGIDIEKVAHAYSQLPKGQDNEPTLPSSTQCQMVPRPRERDSSTLQHAVHELMKNPRREYGDTYYVVVRCKRGWAGDEFYPQRYALVVTLAHSHSGVRLYEAVQLRTQQAVQLRQRVRS